jgi:hypothetical protein
MPKIAETREKLGLAAIVSVSVAASRLPFSKATAVKWLWREGLVRSIAGKRVVCWGEVYNRIAGKEKEQEEPFQAPSNQPSFNFDTKEIE